MDTNKNDCFDSDSKKVLIVPFIGCGFRELGLRVPSTRRIPDKDITASSKRVEGRSAFRGRIGVETMGDWEDGWCASVTDAAPYFQVFFGEPINAHYSRVHDT